MTWAGILARQAEPDGRQVFRSPIAAVIWWIWVLFAVGNLIDLAVQGRDHLSAVAACTLLVITGIVYATAQRPRIIADDDGLTIVNPLRVHQVGWPAVVGFDSTELLRVRCLWTAGDGTESDTRAFYAWAAHSSRRRKLAEEMRAQRRARGGQRPSGPLRRLRRPAGRRRAAARAARARRRHRGRDPDRAGRAGQVGRGRRAGAAAGLQLVLARDRRDRRPRPAAGDRRPR